MSKISIGWFLSFLLLSTQLFAQKIIIKGGATQKSAIDSLYDSALEAYAQNDTLSAVNRLERVLQSDPKHADAFFNLAIISYQQGEASKAIDLFQQAVKQFNDRKAATILREDLHLPVAYADTMFFEDVDTKPMIVTKAGQEPMIVNFTLHKALMNALVAQLQKSYLLGRAVPKGKTLFLSLYFGKDGKVNAKLEGGYRSDLIQKEVTSRLANIRSFIPARHQGKEVVVWGFSLPVKF